MSTPSAPPPPPPTAPGPRPPRERTWLYLGAGIAVAVVVTLVVLVVLPPSSSSGGGSGSALTYSGARPIADRTVANFQGGGWNLLLAAGVVPASTITVPVNGTEFANLSCTFTLVASFHNYTVAGFNGSRTSGEAPTWEFAYVNTGGTLVLVSVAGGSGTILGTLSGGSCSEAAILPTVPSGVVDSSQAAAAVAPYATGFLSAHPNASAVFGLGPGVFFGGSTLGLDWVVLYSTCPAHSLVVSTGLELNATVNAFTGAVITHHPVTNVTCAGSVPFTTVHRSGEATSTPLSLVARRRE